MADTKIRFQAEGLESIHSDMSILVQDARNLSSIFETSSLRVVEGLKEQIKLLRERNSLSGGTMVQTGPTTSTTVPLDFDSLAFPLKDLTSKLNDFIEKLETGGLSLNSSTIESLKKEDPKSVSREGIASSVSSGWRGYGRSLLFNAANEGISLFGQSIRADNPYLYEQQRNRAIGGFISSASAGLAFIPYIGPLLALLGVGIGGAMNLSSTMNEEGYRQIASSERSRSRMARLLGGNPRDYLNYARDLGGYAYGYRNEESLSTASDAIYASGKNVDREIIRGILGASRAFDISTFDVTSLIRSQRGSGQDPISTIGRLFGSLRSSGFSEDQATVQLSDYLKELVSLNQRQLDQFGKSNSPENINTISRLLRAGSELGQEVSSQRVNSIAQSIQSSLAAPTSPAIEALVISAISELNPNAGLFDIKKIQENLLGNPEELSSVFRKFNEFSGGNRDYRLLGLKSIFKGLSSADIELLDNAYKGGNQEEFLSLLNRFSLSSEQIRSKGSSQTSSIELSGAITEQFKLNLYGEKILTSIDKSLEKSIEGAGLFNSLKKLSDGLGSLGEVLDKIYKEKNKTQRERLNDTAASILMNTLAG